MKRLIALLLSAIMILTGCSQAQPQETTGNQTESPSASSAVNPSVVGLTLTEIVPQFESLDDKQLLDYVESSIYKEAVSTLNSEDYFVENVSAVYISKEYLDEVVFNSKSNIYFGYTLAELDEIFQNTKYIFTLGEDGMTTVQELQVIDGDSTRTMLTNVAIGAGVILVCVTVSIVSGGIGAGAAAASAANTVSMIFATSATTAATFSVSSAAIGGISAGITKGIETGEFSEAMEAAALGASEGFKWGAIAGAITGGTTAGIGLYGAAKQTNFTMNEFATMQCETGYPLDVIKEFHTMEEYEAFRDANLLPTRVGSRSVLARTDIDLNMLDAKGRSNLERMQQGLAPLDADGISFELHHVGQKEDGTLAILTRSEHDNPAIHGFLDKTEVHAEGTHWDAERQSLWKEFAKMVAPG